MNIETIRDGLKAACETIDGLRGADTIPEKIDGNTAVIGPDNLHNRGKDQFINYNDAFAGGLVSMHFAVEMFAPLSQGFDRAQNALDGYLSAGTGATTSVVDALNKVNQTGGTSITGVDHVLVEHARQYGSTVVGDATFATVTLAVVVRCNRK